MSDISILIPIYNEAKNIDSCLSSVLAQTYKNFSVICVNDGSTDESQKLLEKWQKRFAGRLKIVNNHRNLGFTYSLNRGLQAITTKYTARLDADDAWLPKKLELQMNFLKKNPDYGLIGSCYINVTTQNKEVHIHLPTDNERISSFLIKGNPFGHSCVVYLTDLVKQMGGYDKEYYPSDDYYLWTRLARLTKMHNISEFLCRRKLGDGISLVSQNRQLRQCLRIQLSIIRERKLSWLNYSYLIPPLITLVTPNYIREIKRRLVG